jgi:hypothetical protein
MITRGIRTNGTITPLPQLPKKPLNIVVTKPIIRRKVTMRNLQTSITLHCYNNRF